MFGTWSLLRRLRPTLLHLHSAAPASDRHLLALARMADVDRLILTQHVASPSVAGDADSSKLRALRDADAVTTVCEAVKDVLVRDCDLDRKRVRVVPNGADLPDDADERAAARRWRDELGIGAFKPLWVCVARLEEQKGHAVLLDALARLQERGLDFVVALAGEGSLRAGLERRAAHLGLGARVRFLGQVDSVGSLLLAADACVIPSQWEAQPLALLEALARERPVVATATGGVPEVIEDRVHGRLVPPGDPQALAEALEEFHRNPDLAWRLGENGGERLRASFTWDRAVEGFEAVYDEMLGLASFAPAGARARSRVGPAVGERR
jgi:glycosyltransferase involved in cell wall biosynthesis